MIEEGIANDAVDIIICAHNSPEDVRRCISSTLISLSPGDRIIVVDDGSADETRELCEIFAEKNPEVLVLIRRPEGSGFCRAANAGIRSAAAPIIVLLNSDTVVPPNWLSRIRACFSANSAIGIVGPLSNAGGWQSIPEFRTGGPPNNRIISDDATLAEIQSYCEELSDAYEYPIVDQLNGFCLAIRKEVFDRIGLLDEEHFPMGYGEEVDFNLRAQDAGFLCAVAIDCFVYHEKTKSYGDDIRERLVSEGRTHIDRLHGADRVDVAVKGCQRNPILAAIRDDAQSVFVERQWLVVPGR